MQAVRMYTVLSSTVYMLFKKARKRLKLKFTIMGAGNIGMQAMNFGAGILLQGLNDRRQEQQQQSLTNIQVRAQKDLANYNLEKQIELWQRTGYGPQVEQMVAAGINPALMYGMKGGGGQTAAANPGQVTGGQATGQQGEVMAMMQNNVQMQLAEAQIELAKSQAKKNNVEADKTAGVDTDEANTRIESLKQGITNQQAQEAILKVEKNLKDIDLAIGNETVKDKIDFIKYNARMAETNLKIAEQNQYIDSQSMQDKLNTIHQTAIGAVLQNTLTSAMIGNVGQDTKLKKAQTTNTKKDTDLKGAQIGEIESQIELNTSQINKWAAEISQKWAGLSIEQKEMMIKGIATEIEQAYKGHNITYGNGIWKQQQITQNHNPTQVIQAIDSVMGIKSNSMNK